MDCSSLFSSAGGRRSAITLGALALAWGAAFTGTSAAQVVPTPGVQAEFKWTPAVGVVGQPVTFESTSRVTGAGNAIVSHRWDLDGSTGNGFELDTGTTPSAVKTYTGRGQFDVRLRVRDTLGNQNTIKKTVTVAGQAPVASYTFAPAAPIANAPVTFTSTATDPDGTIAELVWDLDGDSLYDNGSGPTALRVFPAAGPYVVGLRATDSEGAVSFHSETIVVGAAPAIPAVPAILTPPALRPLSPFPVVRIAGRLTKRGVRLRRLVVDAPPGSLVRIRCKGRGCPFRTDARAATVVRLRRLERRLRAGVRIRVYVTSPSAIGKYTSFKIRRRKPPLRVDACLVPGSLRPVACPTF